MEYYTDDKVQATFGFSILRAGQTSTTTKSFGPLNLPDANMWYTPAGNEPLDKFVNGVKTDFFDKAFALTTSQVRDSYLTVRMPIAEMD